MAALKKYYILLLLFFKIIFFSKLFFKPERKIYHFCFGRSSDLLFCSTAFPLIKSGNEYCKTNINEFTAAGLLRTYT